jgi:hypothetical protein
LALLLAGVGDRCLGDFLQGRIGIRILHLPIVADKLVAEFGAPTVQRRAGRVIRLDAIRPYQQQRVRFFGRAARGSLLCGQMFAGCPQRGGQRVARPHRSLEIFLGQPDLFRLDNDAVGAAFDVDRTAPGAILSEIRDDCVGIFLRVGVSLRGHQAAPPQGDLFLQHGQIAGRFLAFLGGRGIQPLHFFQAGAQSLALFLQAPKMVFKMTELQPRFAQLFGRFCPRLLELADAPIEGFRLQPGLLGFLRGASHPGRARSRLRLGLARKRVEQRDHRAQRADQHRQEWEELHPSG